jgi:predicted permease
MLWRPWAATDSTTLVQILKTRDAEFLFSDYRQLSQDTRLVTIVATNCGRQSRLEDCYMMLDDEKVTPQFVSGNYFRTLGVRMEHGRGFVEDEDRLATPALVAVMSHSLWQRRFGSDAGVVGRTVDLDGVPFTIIGVTAREFSGTSLLRRDIWVPLAASQLLRPSERSAMWVELTARLHPGVTREEARAELQSLVRSEDPRFGRVQLTDTSLLVASNEREDIYAFFAALFLGVLLVLLLVCANVGNLLLARTLARGREIAVRASLGAGRGRLVRQLLTESVVLSCAAAIVGLWIARVLPTYILDQAFQASELGRVAFALKPDGWVLMFTVGLAILTCFAFALAPALYASRRNVADALRDGDGVRTGRFPLRAILLSVQVAASVVLLVGAMLLVRGIQQASTRELGFL